MRQKSAILQRMKESIAIIGNPKAFAKYELVKAGAMIPKEERISPPKPYRPPVMRPKAPKFRLGFSCEHYNFVEGSVKQGFNPDNIVKRFKEKLLEKEAQAARYEQQQNERRAKANLKKEEDAAKDK